MPSPPFRLRRALAGPDARFFVAGVLCVAAGTALMIVPALSAVVASPSPASAAAAGDGGFSGRLPLILAGQVLTTGGVMLFALPFARRQWRRERQAAGRCPECGYDLRATPERCPECGVVPT
jgi:hypothetical protein